MILILDYGAGNLRSVQKAFEHLGVRSRITATAADIEAADKVLLPGVGAFGRGIEAVRRLGYADALGEHISKGKPMLGICLGMQLLFTESEEMGIHAGLGFIEGRVRRFESATEKVPHTGWNRIDPDLPTRDAGVGIAPNGNAGNASLLKGIDGGTYFYFVHSYYCEPTDRSVVTATSDYAGKNFAAVVEKNGIFGAQFHPEKSAAFGLKLLENFARL